MGALLLASCTGGRDAPTPASVPTVQVTVRTEGLDFLSVTTSPLTEAEPGVSRQWLNHGIQVENRGNRTVYIDDHRTGAFLGDREILAADDGCGWAQGTPGEPVETVCHANYRTTTIEVARAVDVPITLWRDLPGMKSIGGTHFEFRKPVQIRFTGPFTDPRDAGEEQGAIVVVYTFR